MKSTSLISKRHPLLDSRTGPEAAEVYRAKHPRLGYRQFSRYLRIMAGLRPLIYDVPTRRERKTIARITARLLKQGVTL